LNNNLLNNKKVYCLVNNKLIDLLSKSFPKVNFITKITNEKFESHIPIGDLAAISVSSIFDLKKYSGSYFNAISEKEFLLKLKLKKYQVDNKHKKICGISWISKNEDYGIEKSISLKELIPILEVQDYIFVDLQYGDTSKERKMLINQTGIDILKVDEIDNFNDLNGLSSLINFCDEVITVSNSTAHLSGSLGKKTLLLKSKGRGNIWYWSNDNCQSYWYNSIKIFEQKKINEWKNVIQDVRDYLINNIT